MIFNEAHTHTSRMKTKTKTVYVIYQRLKQTDFTSDLKYKKFFFNPRTPDEYFQNCAFACFLYIYNFSSKITIEISTQIKI